MQVIIDDYGNFVGKEATDLEFRQKKKEFCKCSGLEISQIIIPNASSIPTEAVKVAIEKT